MADLPSGTVTFLFTNIEGSTRLLQELGHERYARALVGHEPRSTRPARAAYGSRTRSTISSGEWIRRPTRFDERSRSRAVRSQSRSVTDGFGWRAAEGRWRGIDASNNRITITRLERRAVDITVGPGGIWVAVQ
jgi:hypothetical protein